MQFAGVQIVSFLLLLAGTALVITSIATSHWSYDSSGLGIGNVELLQNYRGLWEKCHRINVDLGSAGVSNGYHCVNRFKAVFERASQGDFSRQDQDLQAWEIAVLALMCISALVSVISLVFSPCCCNRCGSCLTFWVLIAALCTVAGVGTYAYEVYSTDQKGHEIASITHGTVTFGWSYWIAVAGGCCQMLSSIGLGISRARHSAYSHVI
ncbi:protein clc isoform [Trichuris trichiura]|uniref:Protein clc isoform n=1 Tax=Trichuris trichiura TaxID=36087 RepID=A0A077ZAT7_TRITR|nr:protein clc isoform [Trichuris trichiura]